MPDTSFQLCDSSCKCISPFSKPSQTKNSLNAITDNTENLCANTGATADTWAHVPGVFWLQMPLTMSLVYEHRCTYSEQSFPCIYLLILSGTQCTYIYFRCIILVLNHFQYRNFVSSSRHLFLHNMDHHERNCVTLHSLETSQFIHSKESISHITPEFTLDKLKLRSKPNCVLINPTNRDALIWKYSFYFSSNATP